MVATEVSALPELGVDIAGPHGAMDARAVSDAITALAAMVRSVAGESRTVVLSSLTTGSAHVGVQVPRDELAVLGDGFGALRRGEMPSGWTDATLGAVLDLYGVTKRSGVDAVAVALDGAIAKIDAAIVANVESVRAAAPLSLGSVRGVLHRYLNDRDKRTASLRDYRTDLVVKLEFPATLAGQFKRSLDEEVEVWGVLVRDPSTDAPLRMTVEGITSVGATAAVDDVVGIYQDSWPDGMDPVEWVRGRRG